MKKQNDFAFASGAVRAMENSLLPRSFFTNLAQARGEELRRQLLDRGFAGFEKTSDPDLALKDRMQRVYEDLVDYLPDRSVLDFCILPHDFHNLKAALKGLLLGGERQDLYLRPATFDPAGLWDIVSRRAWGELPEAMRAAAREGYEILTQTGSGQQFDLALDRFCLEEMQTAAEKAGSFAKGYAEQYALFADLRVALRLARQKPGEALILSALAEVPGLDLPALREAVAEGEEAVAAYITEHFDLPDPMALGTAGFEQALEDRLTAELAQVRNIPCGPEVPIAYYLARETERKNLCILISSAAAGRDAGKALERLRETNA